MVDQCKGKIDCKKRCGDPDKDPPPIKDCSQMSCGPCQKCIELSPLQGGGGYCVRDESCDDPPPPGIPCGGGVTCQGGCSRCRTVCVGDWCHGSTGGCRTLGPGETCPPTSCPTYIKAKDAVCGVGHYHGTVCGIGTLSCGGSGRGSSKPCCGGGSGKSSAAAGMFSRMVMGSEEDMGITYPGDPDFPYSMYRDKDWSEFSNEVPHFYQAKASGWSLMYEDNFDESDYDPDFKWEGDDYEAPSES